MELYEISITDLICGLLLGFPRENERVEDETENQYLDHKLLFDFINFLVNAINKKKETYGKRVVERNNTFALIVKKIRYRLN